jgi:predicted acetyltransferase
MPGRGDVTLVRVSADDAPALTALLDRYLAELAPLFDLLPGPDGGFEYPYLDLYWRQPDLRFAYLIREGEELAGFALAMRGSPATSDPEALDVAEFFVLPSFRRGGVGRRAASLLWDQQPGHWVVRVADGNDGAESFWRGVVAAYAGDRVRESVYQGRSRPFRVFRFASRNIAG